MCASVRDVFTSYPLRNQGFYYRRAAHLHVNGLRESKNPGRIVARLPGKSKVSQHRNGSGDGAAQEHVINVDTGGWCVISNVIGHASIGASLATTASPRNSSVRWMMKEMI